MTGNDTDVQTDGCRETDVRVETDASKNEGDPGTERQVCSDSAGLTDKTFRFKHLSFLHWNVNGLLTKLKDRELIQYISSFYFVCLVDARERWVYDDYMMKVVNSYKYLGICFSIRLSFYHACQDLVSRAKRALLCIMSKLCRIDCNSINVFLKIFDAQVQPIVLYRAEIWGVESCSSVIDNVHLFGLKRYLGVDRRTPNDLVNGEVGRFPIQINACVRCIRYWLKLMPMEDYRLPLRAYKMLFNLDQRGKTNWVTKVRKTLCANGFSYVWDNQGVGCLNAFIREFRQRLIDIRWQAWDDHLNTSDRFSLYRQFKTLTGAEPYLMLNLNRHIRYTLTRFRFGVSDIKVHRPRFKVYNADELKCPLCLWAVENEVHFVLCCPAFDDLRYEFIEPKYFNNPCDFRLALLLAT